MNTKRIPSVLLLFVFPAIIFSQTEFYLTTSGIPAANGCKVLKDTLPIHCSINSAINLTGVVWNPDSLDWCTKEGYYRSRDISHPPVWKIDNTINSVNVSDNGFGITIPVLDTLEHTITATYLEFPAVSVKYKGRNDSLPILICSRNRKIFTSDSIHMSIQSAFPVFFNYSPEMPVIREDSARNNPALLTYNFPSDTSIKLITFLCNHKNIHAVSDFKDSYNPSLNSYSILIPLTNIYYLCKKLNNSSNIPNYTNDTIFAVFKKQSDYDTAKVLLTIPEFLMSKVNYNIQSNNKLTNFGSPNYVTRIYDLSGRVSKSNISELYFGNNLSSGTYIIQRNGINPNILKQVKSQK